MESTSTIFIRAWYTLKAVNLVLTNIKSVPSITISSPLSSTLQDSSNVSILRQSGSLTNLLELCNFGVEVQQLGNCDHLMYLTKSIRRVADAKAVSC